jgi:hypothetical protein
MEIALAVAVASSLFAAYQTGRYHGWSHDALPIIEDQFALIQKIVDRMEQREKESINEHQ